jgi:hypothetical protein
VWEQELIRNEAVALAVDMALGKSGMGLATLIIVCESAQYFEAYLKRADL